MNGAPIDVKQVIYALERQAAALDQQASKLMEQRDYSAEFLTEDAQRMREAAALLQPHVDVHPDDLAVDRFAAAMKLKLAIAREKGRSGWEEDLDDPEIHVDLCRMLRDRVAKGDPLDVANFCMFLHQRDQGILPAPPAPLSADHAQLGRFYNVDSIDALVGALEHHITRLQAKLAPLPSLAPVRPRA